LKAEEKLARKQSQRSRGGNSSRGKGTTREKFQKSKHEADKQHNHHEKGGSSKEGQHGGRGLFSRGRGRGRARGGVVKCYTCGKQGHKSWECLERNKEGGGEEHVVKEQNHVEKEEEEGGGKNLRMRKIILKPEKEAEEPIQRTSLFRTACKTKDRVCKVIIDSGSTDNILFIEMVDQMELKTATHPNPQLSWLHKGHQVMVSQQWQVEFKIRGYRDEILCDVIPMDVFHILLGILWQYD